MAALYRMKKRGHGGGKSVAALYRMGDCFLCEDGCPHTPLFARRYAHSALCECEYEEEILSQVGRRAQALRGRLVLLLTSRLTIFEWYGP